MLCSVGTVLTPMVLHLGVLSLRESRMRENCTYSLSGGRLARKRASSDPSEPRFGAHPNRLGHESLDVTLAYLKGKDAESEEAQEHCEQQPGAVCIIISCRKLKVS